MYIEEVDPTTKKTVSSMCNGSESTRTTGEPIRKRGKQYHKVRYVGVPIIVLGSRLSRPTEAKVWSTGRGYCFRSGSSHNQSRTKQGRP